MRHFLIPLLLLFALKAAANSALTGKVSDGANMPLSQVSILIEGMSAPGLHLLTGKSGAYSSQKLKPGTYNATFSISGYESQRITGIKVENGSRDILLNVRLEKSGSWGNSVSSHGYIPQYVPDYRKPVVRKKSGSYGSAESAYHDELAGAAVRASRAPLEERSGSIPSAKSVEVVGKSPTRRVSEVTSLVMQVYPGGEGLSLGGGRNTGTKYVIDGVAMPAGAGTIAAAPEPHWGSAKDAGDRDVLAFKSSAVIAAPTARAGSLTSGEINDFSKWTLWEDMTMDALKDYRTTWSFRPEERYTVLVKSKNGSPLCNARVKMSDGSNTWEAVTDNTGKAELWYGMWDNAGATPPRLSAAVEYGKQHFSMGNLKPFSAGTNILPTNLSCLNPSKLDIAFIVDATGSMQDEINYLKAELRDILEKVHDSMPAMHVQTGAIFYRDLADTYITRVSDLTPDFGKTEAFISDNNADGGGDFPEAVDVALQEGLNSLHWRTDATARLAFLVLDAPPHSDAATVKRMQELTAQYAARGIRLIPVVCSGSDKSTEYLMRSLALATNGTYLFLTDHSGIGGSHTAPTTDNYDVEYLNGLIYRVIYNCSYMPACDEPVNPKQDTSIVKGPVSDSGKIITWRYYPNPTTGILHIRHTYTTGYLLITDVTGKAILRVPADPSGITTVDLGQYPAGIYAIRYNYLDDKWVSGKFIVVH